MIKSLLIAISLLSIVGCASNRTISQVDSRTKREASQHLSVQADIETAGVRQTVTEISQGELIETEITVYDTDKPIDPATGTPPIKRKEKQTRRSVSDKQKTETSGDRSTASITAEDYKTGASALERQEETISRRGLTWWQKALCWAGGAGLLFLLAWVYFRVFKR